MLVSFVQWRAAQKRKFEADLRRLRKARRSATGTPGGKRWPFARWRRTTLIVVLTCLAVGMAAWQASTMLFVPGPVIVAGRVLDGHSAIDGDTLSIGGQSIRLHGIDAPELLQTCTDGWNAGEAARRTLAGIVTAAAVQCERVTTDRYGRTVAICRVNGEDVGAVMIRSGMAWAYTTYSWRYLLKEWQAWFDGLGVHARNCASPSAWRASHPR